MGKGQGFSRRSVLRAGALTGAAAIGSQVLRPLSSQAVVPARNLRRFTALDQTYVVGTANAGGFRPLTVGPAENRVVREDLGVQAADERATCRAHLLSFVHLSDVHIVDHQSPARVEWTDRLDDPSALPGTGLLTSSYRPQEMLTTQVADAMVQAINAQATGPELGQDFSFAIETGDNTDNAQYNEVRWNIDVLDGGEVTPDSGDLSRYEGVMDDVAPYDSVYWHPEPTPLGRSDDDYKRTRGYPSVPGLTDAARATFRATGLNVPWYSCFGNHDGLVQGNFPPDTLAAVAALATGNLKIMSLPTGLSPANVEDALRNGNLEGLLTNILATATGAVRLVTPDPDRRVVRRDEYVAEHFTTTSAPAGHGFTETNQRDSTAYYFFDTGQVRHVVMDTVNANGYADGAMHTAQFEWVKQVIDATTDKAVLVYSHHTSDTMGSPLIVPDPAYRVSGDDLVAYFLTRPQVIAWVNGHTHKNRIMAHARADGPGGFFEINTAAHIDYPQQARILEVANNNDGTLSIFTSILDHAGALADYTTLDDPAALAAVSRELSANDPQNDRSAHLGTPQSRNTELLVRTPVGMQQECSAQVPSATPSTGGSVSGSDGSGGTSQNGGGADTSRDGNGSAESATAGVLAGAATEDGALPDTGAPEHMTELVTAGLATFVAGDVLRRKSAHLSPPDA